MAEINTGNGDGGGKKNKPQRQQLRVDFTPMVDMNMLLITFFMFVTTLSKPQIMNLVVPSRDDKEILADDQPKTAESRTITLILAEDNIIYYYFGKPNYEDYTSLMQTDFTPSGLRAMLVERNGEVIRQMAELRMKKQREEISEEQFREQSKTIMDAGGQGQVVIIKPTASSTYENLVSTLDEMRICSINTYALGEITDSDLFLIDNFMQQGALSAQAGRNAR